MPLINNNKFFIILILLIALVGCNDNDNEKNTNISADFESGSIGDIVKISDTHWELSVRNDNNNSELPATWRSWWYIRMENIVQNEPIQIRIKNSGWSYYYVPIYSYDQQIWHHFSEDEVVQNSAHELIINKAYTDDTVWIARFYPYTFTDLEKYLDTLRGNPSIDIQIPGYSQRGNPLYLLKITNFGVPVASKKRILLHARTHPAETPPSFLLEGLIEYLLSGSQEAINILSTFEFYIFPMHNVDGVMAGNYRSTPQSENLELMWFFDINNPLDLVGYVPPEIAILHQYAKRLMSDGGPPVSIAINLHASNSEPDIRTFFYPHFGTIDQGYEPDESSLWEKQLRFIDAVANQHGADLLEPIPVEGGGSFADKTYPESWWWANHQDQVMAMTMEMTYGRAGYAPRWIEPDDFRSLGRSLVLAIPDYYAHPTMVARPANRASDILRGVDLKYPESYPPNAPDELKE